MALGIVLAVGTGPAARQLTRALGADTRFVTLGVCPDVAEVPGVLARQAGDQRTLVVLSSECAGKDVAGAVRMLVRQHRASVVLLELAAGAGGGAVGLALEVGAVHAESPPLDADGRITEHRLRKILRLLELLGEVGQLSQGGFGAPDSVTARSCEMPLTRMDARFLSPLELTTAPDSGAERVAVVPSKVPRPSHGETRAPEPSFASDPGGAARGKPRLVTGYMLVGVVSSTGGLNAVETVLAALPPDFPLAVVVAQHLDRETDREYVRLLGQKLSVPVCLVSTLVNPRAGSVYVAPAGRHLQVTALGWLEPTDEPRDAPFFPSATVLLQSMADHLGARAIGVVLTGMGSDGAEGLLALRRAGGRTVVQDQSTSRIFGMPAAAIALDAAEYVLPVDEIGPYLLRLVRD